MPLKIQTNFSCKKTDDCVTFEEITKEPEKTLLAPIKGLVGEIRTEE